MGLRGELLVDAARLESLRHEWDALAVAGGRPYSSPAWMLAWWAHVAPADASLRVAAAFDGDRLAGLVPFWAQRGRLGTVRYRSLASKAAEPLEPLAARGREEAAAIACAAALASARPQPSLIQFDRVTRGAPWPELLRSAWPGRRRPRLERTHPTPAPALNLVHDDFDDWLASKSRNFRQQIRRSRRRLEEAGGSFRLSAHETLERDLDAFRALHESRWEHRGGSGAFIEGVQQMLLQAGQELLSLDRFRLWCLDVGGQTVSAHLFVAAGDTLAYWLGGFDERFATEHPGLITVVVAIEDAFARGERLVDLGPGSEHYKYRLADAEETLELASLAAPGARGLLVRGELASRRAARRAFRRG